MKNILTLTTALLILLASPLQAISCSQFNSIGNPINSLDQIASFPATNQQVKEFKKVVANHAAKISTLGAFSSKNKALKHLIKHKRLVYIIRDSLALTRAECFIQPSKSMKAVAIEQFDYLLDAVATKL